MTLATKIKSNPRITDKQLIDLISNSSQLTSAFGAKKMLDWSLLEEKLTASTAKLSEIRDLTSS